MRLTELLTDSDPDVRRTAAESLGKIGERSAGDGLLAALKDHDPRVRAAAARSLGNLGDGASGVLLAGRLADSSEAVRVASALALSEIESSASSEAESLRMLHHQDAAVRLAATRALGGRTSSGLEGNLSERFKILTHGYDRAWLPLLAKRGTGEPSCIWCVSSKMIPARGCVLRQHFVWGNLAVQVSCES